MALKEIHRYVPAGSVKVADKKSDAVAYLYEVKRGERVDFVAVAYHGKAGKADWHFRYASAAAREAKVKSHFEWRQAVAAAKVERAEVIKAKRAAGHKLEVGHILVCSWGYEQTQVDFYQVVRLVGKASVALVKIPAVAMEASGPMSDRVMPGGSEELASGEEIIKRVSAYDGASVKLNSYSSAYLWDGKPKHRSWYY